MKTELPITPFNLFPTRSADGFDGLVLNGCDARGNCNIPVAIFEESGGMFLHGYDRAQMGEIATDIRHAVNAHPILVGALESAQKELAVISRLSDGTESATRAYEAYRLIAGTLKHYAKKQVLSPVTA